MPAGRVVAYSDISADAPPDELGGQLSHAKYRDTVDVTKGQTALHAALKPFDNDLTVPVARLYVVFHQVQMRQRAHPVPL